jgi:hypothetical protein
MRRVLLSRAIRTDPPMLAGLIEHELDLAGGEPIIVGRLEDSLGSVLADAWLVFGDPEAARDALELRDPATGEVAGRIVNIDRQEGTPVPESTHRITLQLHVDDEELERQRADYIAANPADEDLEGFYGRPREWSSILDIIDAHEAAVILRTELVDREHGVTPYNPYGKRPLWRRLLRR